MTEYPDLEIGLHAQDADSYRVEARLRLAGVDAKQERLATVPSFDIDDLGADASDPDAYGRKLTKLLFASESQRSFLDAAWAAVASSGLASLRLRLNVGPTLPELHNLRWETLRHPYQLDRRLATDENILFSRYLGSQDWRAVRPQPRGDLRALVLIANPANLASLQPQGRSLAPVDVDGELERARIGLAGIPLTSLASGGSATLEGIDAGLRDGCDILYLVCHGALLKGEPHLWLEDEAGNVAVTAGAELVTRMGEMRQTPRLVILASCQSAGDGDEWASTDGGALAALGPRLAKIGIPAVVAMQGDVMMRTVAKFMPVFFEELQRDGQIDRAVAVARRTVRDQPDWWVPVLFTRLESGRLFVSESVDGEPEHAAGPLAEPAGTEGYSRRAVRDLLLASFGPDSLRRLLYFSDNPGLRRVVNEFSSGDGLTVRVDKTIDYCTDRRLLRALLDEVQRENPAQYARFEPHLRG
jgi:hypothetical protein